MHASLAFLKELRMKKSKVESPAKEAIKQSQSARPKSTRLDRRKPENLLKIQDHAISKGGLCLSRGYINDAAKYRFRCFKGHEFEISANKILGRGDWCPYCSRRKIENPLLELQLIAKERNGAVISKIYKGGKEKMEFKCGNGHLWKAQAISIRAGSWCGQCKNKTESLVRNFLELIFSTKLPPKRMLIGNQWVILDGYCEKQKIAFEYHGEQHSKQSKFFHDAKRTLAKQKARDGRVRFFCKKEEIFLIEISSLKFLDIDGFLEGITLQLNPQEVQVSAEHVEAFKGMKLYSLELQGLIDHAKSKKGSLLANSYIGMAKQYQWKCSKGHVWRASADSVVCGSSWCIVCAGLKLERPLEDLKKLAIGRGGKCLSNEYINAQTKMLFKCKNVGHPPWWSEPNNIKSGKWCFKCSSNYIPNPIEGLKEIAIEKGWRLISREYVNAHTKLLFECSKKKHKILSAPTSMKSHPLNCPACAGRSRSQLLIENQHSVMEEKHPE